MHGHPIVDCEFEDDNSFTRTDENYTIGNSKSTILKSSSVSQLSRWTKKINDETKAKFTQNQQETNQLHIEIRSRVVCNGHILSHNNNNDLTTLQL